MPNRSPNMAATWWAMFAGFVAFVVMLAASTDQPAVQVVVEEEIPMPPDLVTRGDEAAPARTEAEQLASQPAFTPQDPNDDARGSVEQVTVQPGDNLWTITEHQLAENLGHHPTATETAPHWQHTINTNLPTLRSGDPDLIYPGEHITVPNHPQPPPPPEASQPPRPAEPTPSPQPQPATTSTTSQPSTPTTTVTAPPAAPASSLPASSTSTARPTSTHDGVAAAAPRDDSSSRGLDDLLVPIGTCAVLAAVALGTLARRRRSAGTTHPRPAKDITPGTGAAATPDDATQRAANATAALAAAFRDLTRPPSPVGIVVRPTGDVAIHLANPTTPVEPFIGDDGDPTVWLLPSGRTNVPAGTDNAPASAALAALGLTSNGAWAFVDLEALGAVWVDGDTIQATQLARSLIADLAPHHHIDLTVVGDIETPETTEPDTVTVCRLDEDTTRRIQRLANGTTRPLGAKAHLQGPPRDGLSVSVFVIGPGADPVLLNRAARAATPGNRGIAIVAFDPIDEPATQLVARSDGTLDVPHLDLTIHPAGLTHAVMRHDDVLHRHEPEAIQVAPAAPPLPTPPHPSPGVDADDAVEPYQEPAWDYCVRLFADNRVETSNGNVVSFRQGDNPAVASRNAHRGPELVAYLALQPDRSAALHEIREHLWWGRRISDRTVHNFISGTRRALGGTRYISHADGDDHTGRRYALTATIVTDHELLDRALNYAHMVVDSAPSLALAALRPHIARIQAPAFRTGHLGAGLTEWANACRVIYRIEQSVIDAALLYATHADDGELDNARWAIDQALKACSLSEALIRAAMELEAEAGRSHAATRRYHALSAQLMGDGLEPEQETVDLHRRITRSADKIG